MTISSTTRKAGPFAGNDVTVDFPFTFKVFSTADLYVVKSDSTGAETELILTTDFTVSLNADQNDNPGGTLTLPVALATGYNLTITSDIAALQPVDLTNAGGFYPSVINTAFDRLTMLIQQLAESVSRSLKFSISTPSGTNPQLPTPVPYALIGWNGDGTGFQNSSADGSDSAIAVDLAASSGAGMVGFLQSGTGAVARTAQSKMRDVVSVFDFMTSAQIADVIAGTALVDVTAAIQAAINSLTQAGYDATAQYPQSTYIGKSLFFPSGVYLVSSELTLAKSGLSLIGQDRGSVSIVTNSATASILTVSTGTTTALFHACVRNMQFGTAKGTTRTAGHHLKLQNVRNCTIENLGFYDPYNGLIVEGGYKLFAYNLLFQDKYGNAVGNRSISLLHNNTASVEQPNVTDCRFYSCMIGGNITNPLYVDCTDWNIFDGLHINVAQDTSVILDPAGGALKNIWKLQFVNCYFDSAVRTHVQLKNAGTIEGLHFDNCYFTSYQYTGQTDYNVEIQNTRTGPTDDLVFDNCYFDDAGLQSIYLNGTDINQVKISDSYLKKFVGLGSSDANIIYSAASFTQVTGCTFESEAGAVDYVAPALQIISGKAYVRDNDFSLCQHPDKVAISSGATPFVSGNIGSDGIISLEHNTAISFPIPRNYGTALISSSSAGALVQVYYRAYTESGGALCEKMAASMTLDHTEVATGVLAGTTGTVSKLTISVGTADNNLYIENRRGFAVNISVDFV